MSENEEAGERTEQPTEKRLKQARDQGNIPRSRELSTAAVFSVGIFALMGMSQSLTAGAVEWMKAALSPDLSTRSDPNALFSHTGHLLVGLLWVALPLIGVCLAAGFIAPLMMGGLRLSGESLVPKFSRLNPMSGLARLYGPESVAELIKSMLRMGFVGGAVTLSSWGKVNSLRGLLHQPLEQAVSQGLGFTLHLLLYTAGALALLAAIDAPYQKWNYTRKLKMTREEVRREMKESEGSPEIKGKIRQMQMQLSQRRMMEAVPTADVVVVNPTHYAVALKYESGRMRAPTVVAKGVDEIAFHIREIGEQHRVAVVSAPPLARALYREGELGKEIPVRLYSAVAQILSYVYQLRAWRTGPMPPLPPLEVEEFAPGTKP